MADVLRTTDADLADLAPIPDEEQVMRDIRWILRSFTNGYGQLPTPDPHNVYALHIVLDSARGWEVEYVCNEFSSGYGEAGHGLTLTDALTDLDELNQTWENQSRD